VNISESFQDGVESAKFPKAEVSLRKFFNDLSDDYNDEQSHPHACSQMAADIAKLILEEGGLPRLLSVRGRNIDSINTEVLIPKRYEGRIRWGGHVVCAVGDTVYDPLVGVPISLKAYLNEVFENPAQAYERVSVDEIEDFISR
jgi:hypothetical protein